MNKFVISNIFSIFSPPFILSYLLIKYKIMEEINYSQIKEDSPIRYSTTINLSTENHYNYRIYQSKPGNSKISYRNCP